MTVIKAFILGLIQGISEFLPISSSGHLSIAGQLMGMDPEASNLLSFNILLHVATLAAVFIVFWNDIWEMIKAFFGMLGDLFTGKGLRLKEFTYRRLIIMLIAGTIPAVFAALFLGDIIENPELWQIGIFLIITAILLFLSEKLAGGNISLEEMSVKRAFCVGCFQGLGTLPGISRSGSTIVGGLFSRLEKSTAVRFSFLLSIPAILGALVLDLKDMVGATTQTLSFMPVAVGMITAAISGYFSIRFLLRLVEKSKLSYFSYYCVAAGVFAIILNFTI
ncbi:MAG: undecaprenyl-diphosphate phosphatase [Clostridia bacterium]|nr:undecaprenyl-diphosphate phosphatase [Clostridia bacterium]